MIQPGDILMFRVDPGAPLLDRLIGWGERLLGQSTGLKQNYYHVGFVSEDPTKYFQSKPPCICLTSIPDPLPPHIEIFRLKEDPLSQEGLARVFAYAKTRIGKPYNFLGLLTAGYVEIGGLEFCSQFTANAFSYYPAVLRPHELLTSPDDIALSASLIKIA